MPIIVTLNIDSPKTSQKQWEAQGLGAAKMNKNDSTIHDVPREDLPNPIPLGHAKRVMLRLPWISQPLRSDPLHVKWRGITPPRTEQSKWGTRPLQPQPRWPPTAASPTRGR